jgi:hypothetical protein
MRKFTVTGFTILYAALIVFSSAERAGDWAVKEAESLSHHQDVHGCKTLGKGGKHDSRLGQTRLLESGFVMELPREAVASPIPSQRHASRRPADRYISAFARLIPSRAPPSIN